MRLHKEGFIIIPVSAVLVYGLFYGLTWLLPFEIVRYILGTVAIIFWGLIVAFFRIPKYQAPTNEKAVVAPAEGKVVVIEKAVEDEYLKEERIHHEFVIYI